MKQEKKAPKEAACFKLWKLEQLEELPPCVPGAVKDRVQDIIKLLNRHYGEGRQVDEDLGGYVAIFPEGCQRQDYEALLDYHHLGQQEPEYQEPLCQDGAASWIEELFLCGSDYGLVIIRPDMPRKNSIKESKER